MRRDAMKAVDALEKKGDLGEDEAKALSDTVQELTDDYVKQVARSACCTLRCWGFDLTMYISGLSAHRVRRYANSAACPACHLMARKMALA